MAKRSADVNKAAEIRKEFAKHPDAKGVEVVAALAKRGIEVSQAQVSNVKTSGEKKKPGKPVKTNDLLAQVQAAKNLIDSLGADQAHKLIDTLK